jgi:hypothetical protein
LRFWCDEPDAEPDRGASRYPAVLRRGALVVTSLRIRKFFSVSALAHVSRRVVMDVLIERCAGLDVHKRTVVATVRSPGAAGKRRSVTQSFSRLSWGRS